MLDIPVKKQRSQKARGSEFVQWMAPLLEALRTLGDSGTPREVTDLIARQCQVPDAKREELTSTNVPRFSNQVAWARQYLVWEGLLSSEKRGIWALTDKGKRTTLNDNTSRELFLRWVAINAERRKEKKESEGETAGPAVLTAQVIEADIEEKSELLSVLQRLTPKGFENFCKYLLRVHGFEKVEVTPDGRDGGIDGYGVLQLNPFVSFKVIFQCKRYVGTVSRAQVGDLRNAMIGRADKGIMITTGVFSEDAKREASREGAPPIELIDGNQLVEMLKKEEVGVKPRMVYDVDYDFFRTYLPEE